jgi:DNA polymerase-3 subunit beta
LPGEVVHGIAKLLGKGDTAKFSGAPERMTLQAGRSRYTINGMNPDEFPLLDRGGEGVTFTMPATTLAELIDATRIAVSTDETRFYLNGVYLANEDGRLVAVATDGHRLVKREAALPGGAEDLPGIIVPAASLREMMSLLASCDADVTVIVRGEERIIVRAGGETFGSRLVNGEFPDYNRVIPRGLKSALTVRSAALAEAVQRASVVYAGTDVKGPSAHVMAAGDVIKLRAGAAGGNDAAEEVEAEVRDLGPDFKPEFKVNSRYLGEMLAKWPETAEVEIAWGGLGSPILFTSPAVPEQTHVIMPMTK